MRIPAETCGSVMLFEPDWGTGVGDDLAEVFSPPRVVTIARRSGLKAQWSFDKLVEKEPGVPWDFIRKDHQRACLDIIKTVKPGIIIGSPPCSWFSQIMQLNWRHICRRRRRSMMREAREYLNFSCQIYHAQNSARRLFLHEHPKTASSWREPEMQKLLNTSGVHSYDLDMCRFNLRQNGELVKKNLPLLLPIALP